MDIFKLMGEVRTPAAAIALRIAQRPAERPLDWSVLDAGKG